MFSINVYKMTLNCTGERRRERDIIRNKCQVKIFEIFYAVKVALKHMLFVNCSQLMFKAFLSVRDPVNNHRQPTYSDARMSAQQNKISGNKRTLLLLTGWNQTTLHMYSYYIVNVWPPVKHSIFHILCSQVNVNFERAIYSLSWLRNEFRIPSDWSCILICWFQIAFNLWPLDSLGQIHPPPPHALLIIPIFLRGRPLISASKFALTTSTISRAPLYISSTASHKLVDVASLYWWNITSNCDANKPLTGSHCV